MKCFRSPKFTSRLGLNESGFRDDVLPNLALPKGNFSPHPSNHTSELNDNMFTSATLPSVSVFFLPCNHCGVSGQVSAIDVVVLPIIMSPVMQISGREQSDSK